MAVLSVFAALAAIVVSAAAAQTRTGRIVGNVHECNTPVTCVIQPFTVSARNRTGVVVAKTTTTGDNYFAFRLAPGPYALTARASGGLTCNGSATAVAGQTVQTTVTCLVP